MSGYGGRGPSMPARRKRAWQAPYKMSKNRVSWVKTAIAEIIMYRHENAEQVAEDAEEGVQPEALAESGDSIQIVLNKTRGRPIWLNLTAMTELELEGFKQVVDRAYAAARPICRHRDEEAHAAFTQGDDSYQRIYRPVPVVFIREGEERQYGESVWHGPSNLRQRDAGSDGGELRAQSDDVAD